MSVEQPEVLTPEQASEYLRIDRRDVQALIRAALRGESDFPVVEFGPRKRRIPRFSLDAWLERQTLRQRTPPLQSIAGGVD
jgi:excisionase family DNA binding protein